MAELEKYLINGAKEKITISDYVFGIEPHNQAIYDVVNAQRAAMRQGTHATKTRAMVSGGGKKPWKQKGTGRARQGSTRSPQWYHGGIVFGPQPHKYNVKINLKVRQLALRSALSYHFKNNTLIIIDNLKFEAVKTKEATSLLKRVGASNKNLILDCQFDDNFALSARNIASVNIQSVNRSSVYDILNAKTLILSESAVKYYEEVYHE
ncbi:MAG: 50S ribosomal protein L4 [Acholeplasmatales bacterium]|jgi:large subunit ribosomal protein L4|nr:50S ribosomal protein L4 [Acholeplasmatales bacterium]